MMKIDTIDNRHSFSKIIFYEYFNHSYKKKNNISFINHKKVFGVHYSQKLETLAESAFLFKKVKKFFVFVLLYFVYLKIRK